MSLQTENENILLKLWELGERWFDTEMAKVTKAVAKVERQVYLPQCQLETGHEYPCHRQGTVALWKTGTVICIRCYRSIA